MERGDFLDFTTHAIAALLGGGLSSLVRALTERRQADLGSMQAWCDQLQEERRVLNENCVSLRAQVGTKTEELLACKHATLILMRQIMDLGHVPKRVPEWANHGWIEAEIKRLKLENTGDAK